MPRRLAIPRRLTIKGRPWRVVTRKRLRVGKSSVLGASSQSAAIIELQRGMSLEEREATFVHEFLHAIWPEDVVSEDVEETLVTALEEPLYRGVLLMSGRKP